MSLQDLLRLLHTNSASAGPGVKEELTSTQHEKEYVAASAKRIQNGDYSNIVVGDYHARERARTNAAEANRKRYEVPFLQLPAMFSSNKRGQRKAVRLGEISRDLDADASLQAPHSSGIEYLPECQELPIHVHAVLKRECEAGCIALL
jgi:hypothetical protein